MRHDVVIVGGGMAGLTAAAFLCKAGLGTILLEKEKTSAASSLPSTAAASPSTEESAP